MANPRKHSQSLRRRIRTTDIAALPTTKAKLTLLCEYATLAPSTHNTQPWYIKLQPAGISVYVDTAKKIPAADPTGRDMYLSLGALIQNFQAAANAMGVKVTLKPLPDQTDKRLVAQISCQGLDRAQLPQKSPVLDAIVQRQNYRGMFAGKLTKKQQAWRPSSSKEATITPVTDPSLKQNLAELTAQGLRGAYATPAFRQEISGFIHHNRSRKKHGLHGYSLRMTLWQSIVIPKLMKRKDLGPKLAKLNYASFMSAPLVMVLGSADTKKSWLAAGMALEAAWLSLTEAGMTASMYAAAIETPASRQKITKLLKLTSQPQLLFCVGAATASLHYSVRRPIKKILK